MSPAPIALFTYKRPDHTRQTVEALLENREAAQSDLYVFSDGPKSAEDAGDVDAVRRYVETLTGFSSVTVVKRFRNVGLSQSIIEGVTDITNRHGRVIVVEDDIVTSPFFLSYMNDGLEVYESEADVICIHGYVYPLRVQLPETFFIRGADCWGWATWQRGWRLFNSDAASLLDQLTRRGLTREFDFKYFSFTAMLRRQVKERIDSWAIRWYASAFLAGKLTLYPGTSLVRNIGFDASGTHSRARTKIPPGRLLERRVVVRRLPPVEDPRARSEFERFFRRLRMREMPARAMRGLRHPRVAFRSVRPQR